MPKARKLQISLEATPYYHCTSRCVRRAYLCGIDHFSGKSYEHRRQWVEDRILLLGQTFSIDVCAYAVMSNHHHVVLHVNTNQAENWGDIEVCLRWHTLFKGIPLSHRFAKGEHLDEKEQQVMRDKVNEWREKLCSISWFMRALNEPIARMANAEDECTGKFWESRFRSQALLDEKALIACMAYVDLNPVRAKVASAPETSDHTSIKHRIDYLKQTKAKQQNRLQSPHMMPFRHDKENDMSNTLPFGLFDYLELVDLTGRAICDNKRGYIDAKYPHILEGLEISPKQWFTLTTQFESRFKDFVGCTKRLRQALTTLGLSRCTGFSQCKALLS